MPRVDLLFGRQLAANVVNNALRIPLDPYLSREAP